MNNTALNTLYVANGLFVFAASMLVPVYALFADSQGASIFMVSLLAATMQGAKFIGTYISGKFGDKFKEQEFLLVAGYILRIVGWLWLVASTSLLSLFLVQIIFGVGDAVGSPSFRALFSRHLDKGKEFSEYANWELIISGTAFFGAVIGGLIVTKFGFQILFLLMSLLTALTTVMILLKPRSLL